jgi:glycine hydroxymethyltransferase
MSASPERRIIDVDPQTSALIAAEERRQREKIILIPSESLTPPPVREALSSAFTSLYAEGYPRAAMISSTPDELADLDLQMAAYRRYADRRFYKGTEYADVVESLAIRRVSECFATPETPAERIFANVQALSGAAANLAVYDAFVEPGETVMGMALTEGGHLTHGSQFNVTGKRYHIVSYAVDPRTGRLDYEQIRCLAEQHRPKMIIGGFTSYPWQPDWQAFREIADAVGAVLLADVAHTAGLIVGGQYPNPVGIADVITFTTHKTLCGPRGAVILSTDPKVASRVDTAVFPGHQGGPHVNKFAALAVALKLAQRTEFKDLQRRIVENAAALAAALEKEGLCLAYGGTNTHLLLLDLRTLPSETGFVMMGEIASRILDLAGIVCNKNTLPGDTSAADAHGIRLGTPWVTQRGMGRTEMEQLAVIIARVLRAIRPFSYAGLTGPLSRGKLPMSELQRAQREVRALITSVDPTVRSTRDRSSDASLWGVLRLRGGRILELLDEATPAKVYAMKPGDALTTALFDEAGMQMAEIILGAGGDDELFVLTAAEDTETVAAWLSGLADGYIVFDEEDIFRKVQGPAVVERIMPEDLPEIGRRWMESASPASGSGLSIEDVHARSPESFHLDKAYFVGQSRLAAELPSGEPETWSWSDEDLSSLQRTALFDAHGVRGARVVPFAGWEMPVWYTSALEEHRAVRTAAGLFDLGHMGVFQVSGPLATQFLNGVCSNYTGWLRDGQSQYAYLFDPDGNLLDDIFLYRRAQDRYLVVVNAANERKDWAWLNAVNDGDVVLDRAVPRRRIPRVRIQDLKADRGVVDLALQGPASPGILARCLAPQQVRTLNRLQRTEFCELDLDGHQLIVARTGYAGEEQGYEIYVGGSSVSWLWERLLEVGEPYGLLPCGLASRDSTRTEAGLPLYGHELAGPHGITPYEAGFGSYVKLHKPFFVGRSRCVRSYAQRERSILRFGVGKGARKVSETAAVLDRTGTVLGHVTSCVSVGDAQIGLALVNRAMVDPGTALLLINPPRGSQDRVSGGTLSPGDRITPPIHAVVQPRFMARDSMPATSEE